MGAVVVAEPDRAAFEAGLGGAQARARAVVTAEGYNCSRGRVVRPTLLVR